MEELTLEDKDSANFKQFLDTLINSDWAPTASEKTIDNLFKHALQLEDIFNQSERTHLKEEIMKNYPSLNLSRLLDLVLENIIKNQSLDEHLTLYAVSKYSLLYSKEDLTKFLENLLSEVELRNHLHTLIEGYPDVDLDFFRLNKFLTDILNSPDLKSNIENALRTQTLTFLKAIKHSEALTGSSLIIEIIDCLETQTDLRLWFTILKEKNLDTVLDLCVIYGNFFNAVLRFFNKFAEEIEMNFDEELSVQYSHVNLDFEDFVKILQMFINHEGLKKITTEFLDSKTLSDRNFCFWIDVKACL